ncbi:MAG: hypothetical protein II323_06815 [Tidjanibacter sp.]|nr:hypothetical protein [Tidjanibacter sp.]
MKMNIKSFFATLLALATLSACTTEPAIDDLEGKYPAPKELSLTLLSQERVKGEKVNTFHITLATEGVSLNGEQLAGSGQVLDLQFFGGKYYLEPTTYTPAEEEKAGRYFIGNNGSAYYTVENGTATATQIEKGSITVAQVENDYEIYGTLWLVGGEAVKFESAANIVYEGFPEPTKLTQLISATSNVASGTMSVTLNLGTADISSTTDPTTWQTVWTGEGYYLAVDLYSADGYLHEGTYTASAAGGAINEGEFGIGWDPGDLWGIGMVFENWGTCWWTVSGGTTSAEKITEGEIVVAKSGSTYTITYQGGDIWCEYKGKVDALNPSAGEGGNEDTNEYVELSNLISATSNVANGTKSLTINMGQEGISSTTDPNTWQTVWTGEGNYLALDIYSEDGKLYTGTYNASAAGGAINAGEFGIGWDPGDLWGIGMVFENWGTCWWTVSGGATSAQKVVDGTVTVAVEGANLVIKLLSSTTNAKFTYPVAEFKDAAGNVIEVVNLGGGEPEPDVDYVELVTVISATSNVANGTKSVTLNLAEEGISSTTDPTTWQTTWEGEGHYLAVDLYSEDGTIAPGTYTACATGGTINAGEFGIGWDPGDLWGIGMVFENWGTCWWTVSGGATSAEKVVDGTIEVSLEGNVYTIALQSSLVNARYIGEITIP